MSQYTQIGQIDYKPVRRVLKGKVPVAKWADGLTPELRRVLPLPQATWHKSTLGDLADSVAGYERDSNVKLHISKSKPATNSTRAGQQVICKTTENEHECDFG